MIQLLFTAIFAEMAVILILLFKTPLRMLVILILDRVKQGNSAPLVLKTVAGVVFAVLLVSLYSFREIHGRGVDALNPTDQILSGKYLLEASLMGFLLFLSLMIDRMHHYMRELHFLRETTEAAKMQNLGFEDAKNGSSEKVESLGEEVSTLRTKIMQLESERETKDKRGEGR